MDNLLKKETFLGNEKVILGDNKADLILQSLGKVYIKFGNNLKLLNDLFKLLDADITKDNAKSYIIIGKPDKFPGNGFFIYDNDILYITVDNEYIPLVNTKDFTEGNYVSKKGDTMTGTLTINTSKVPLIVTSKALVNNLNAELLGGYNSNSFAKVNKDETIKGNWKFEGTNEANKWNFKDTVTFEKNIVSYGDISSPEFSSGYHGYGWKLDSSTNTLTIDNLIVRKVMMVYELVINQISATNGSLWVTNSAKCKEVINISEEGELLSSNTYYLYEDGSKKYVLYTFDNFDPVEFENNLPLQPESRVKYLIDLINSGSQQNALVVDYTSDYSDITKASIIIDNNGVLETVNLYSKYFSSSNYIIVRFENETRPLFKCGDLLRCQKFQDTYIRYYDAIIITSISDSTYLLNISDLFNDNYSTMENGVISNKANTLLYSKANYNPPENPEEAKSNIGEVCEGDDLVQIGNIFDETRQGSVYITSTDNQGPYLEVLDDINRPDYSVILKTPDFYRFYKNGINYYIGVDNDYDYDDKAVLKYDSTLDEYVSADLGIVYALHKYPKSTCFIRKDSENQNKYVYKTSTKVRLGKLDGIYNPLFEDNQPKGYGLYAENVYLTGEFFLNNGQSVAEIAKDYINIGTRLDGIDSALEGMPTLGNLQKAGLYIDTVHNQVVLYGNQIGIVTTAPPEDQPIEFTALFSNGKIKTDYLELGNLQLTSENIDYSDLATDIKTLQFTGQAKSNTGSSGRYNYVIKGVALELNKGSLYNSNGELLYDSLKINTGAAGMPSYSRSSFTSGTYRIYNENSEDKVSKIEDDGQESEVPSDDLYNGNYFSAHYEGKIGELTGTIYLNIEGYYDYVYIDLTKIIEDTSISNEDTISIVMDSYVTVFVSKGQPNQLIGASGWIGTYLPPGLGVPGDKPSYAIYIPSNEAVDVAKSSTTIGPDGIKIYNNAFNYLLLNSNLFIVSIGAQGIKIDGSGIYKRDTTGNWVNF